MKLIENPHRDAPALAPEAPFPSVDPFNVAHLLNQCPRAAPTPLRVLEQEKMPLIWAKDERDRMGLGSFKALGAAYVIATDAAATGGALAGHTYVTASAGNHGMSVAAGARVFGAQSVVFIAETVPETFASRLSGKGAEVRREGRDYAASMAAAENYAAQTGATLLSDSSWEGYTDIPRRLMEGYLQMAVELVEQCPEAPTHIFLQAGVGGMAGSVAAYARHIWRDAPKIIVVEPDAAPALQASIEAGQAVTTFGPDSSMGRLDCKTPSLIALNGLARDADAFLTLSDEKVASTLPFMKRMGLATTPSGGAGLAAALIPKVAATCGLEATSRVLAIISEGPE